MLEYVTHVHSNWTTLPTCSLDKSPRMLCLAVVSSRWWLYVARNGFQEKTFSLASSITILAVPRSPHLPPTNSRERELNLAELASRRQACTRITAFFAEEGSVRRSTNFILEIKSETQIRSVTHWHTAEANLLK